MKKWSKIINENYDAVLAEAKEAFCDAVDCQTMKFTVEIREDGEVFFFFFAAGSHSFTQSSYEGRSTVVCSFCFEHADIEIGDDVLRDHMTAEQIAEAERRAEDEGLSFDSYVYSSGDYTDVLAACEEEHKAWFKDEYAYIAARDAVDLALENARQEEAYSRRYAG